MTSNDHGVLQATAPDAVAPQAPAPVSDGSLFDEAYTHHQAGDLAKAEALYRRFLEARPDDVDGLHLLGLACAQADRTEEGALLMGRAVELRPSFGLAHYNLGNALRHLGRHEESAEAFHNAVRLMPGHVASLLNLGAGLRRLGRVEEAADAYRRASAIKPRVPQTHYNLGCALQHLGRLEAAVQAYRRAVTLDPAFADAWANLGSALLALGRPVEALDAGRRRAALEPTSVEALRGLSQALLGVGQVDAGVDVARRAVRLQPEDADAQIQLGNALLEQGATAAALAAYGRAAALRPNGAEAWVNLAVGLQEAGQTADAFAAVQKALERDPLSAAAWTLYGGLKTFRAEDPDIDVLIELSAAEGLSVEDRVNFEYTLGKAFMDVGEPERAFARFDAGARLHRSTQRYDVKDDVEQFAEIARSTDADALVRRAGHGNPSEQPVFIVGMPRSGTTLVEQILASHPQVFGAGEIGLLERLLIDRLGPTLAPLERARRLEGLTRRDLASLGDAYAEAIGSLAPGAARIADKTPSNFRFAGLIRLILPNARIISCRRDPVDTCLSCYAHKFSRGRTFTYDLAELGTYYRAYEALMAHWGALLPADRLLEVVYEDVVDDLEGQARRLVAFCGLDWDDACLAFHQTRRTVRTASVNQVRQPIYRSAIGRAKAYEPHLGALLEALKG